MTGRRGRLTGRPRHVAGTGRAGPAPLAAGPATAVPVKIFRNGGYRSDCDREPQAGRGR